MPASSFPAPLNHIERVARDVIDAAICVHRRTGPGLLESVYKALLAQELRRRGYHVVLEPRLGFEVDGLRFQDGLRPDMIVDHLVVVELKSAERMDRVYWKQTLTYLRILGLPLGLLINFGAATLKEGGIHRVLNNYRPPHEVGGTEGNKKGAAANRTRP